MKHTFPTSHHFTSLGALVAFLLVVPGARSASSADFSPSALAIDSASGSLYVAAHTGNRVLEFNTSTRQVTRTIFLSDPPTGLALSADGRLYVTAGLNYGTLFVIDRPSGRVSGALRAGHSPTAPVLDATRNRLYLANRFENRASVVDLNLGRRTAQLDVRREPVALALTPDGNTLVVAHLLPDGPANTGFVTATVTLVNAPAFTIAGEVQLPNGSTGVRGVCISPDGLYAYITHLIGRFQVPTTQLDRGWVMTDAVSIIELRTRQRVNTVLVDDPYKGAANPWAIACSPDGAWLGVTHAGSQELSLIDRAALHLRLQSIAAGQKIPGGFSDSSADVPNDLGFLSGIRVRIPLAGNGPRALVLNNTNAFVGEYFSDSLGMVSGFTLRKPAVASVRLGVTNAPSLARQGEMIFNDARVSYQCWVSCTSCHPDGRADGLNWDMPNDALGSARSAKSMLHAHATPPAMVTGIRSNAQVAVRAGFKFIAFTQRPESDALAVDEYLMSMQSVPHPSLDQGQLSPAAARGQALFSRARCAECHSGTYFTDMRKYDVGTGRIAGELLDTPSLIEVWRTAPYLQDGRAASLREVLTSANPADRHGKTSDLTTPEVDDLVAYVASLGRASDDSSACRAWKLAYLGNPDALDNADADADGSPNLLEYYFGTNPLLPDSAPIAWHRVDPTTLRTFFPSGFNAPDVTATLYQSFDLQNWSPYLTLPRSDSGLLEVTVPLGPGPQGFYRFGLNR